MPVRPVHSLGGAQSVALHPQRMHGRVLALAAALLACGTMHQVALAQTSEPRVKGEPRPERNIVISATARIAYLGRKYEEPLPLSLVDKPLTDNGIQGARIGIGYNRTTGNLLGHAYDLVEAVVDGETKDLTARATELLGEGIELIVADLEPADLLAIADLPQAKSAVILSIRSSSDRLRGKECRSNVFHIMPSYAMRADAFAQYMAWKQWRRWFVISGQSESDKEYLAAIKRAASRFGARIVEERTYTFEAGYRRTDDGHQQIQTQMPLLTQQAPEHDIVVVVDLEETFGDYLLWRTFMPRPVAGTHGLMPVAWHRSFEQYAAMQMQNRFERLAGRAMTERDYAAWVAIRAIGEAVTRTGRTRANDVKSYMLSDAFEVAGFKGIGMTFRSWDQQLRQPVLLSGPRTLVSISPQPGFLHEKQLTDTLGIDAPETTCNLK